MAGILDVMVSDWMTSHKDLGCSICVKFQSEKMNDFPYIKSLYQTDCGSFEL